MAKMLISDGEPDSGPPGGGSERMIPRYSRPQMAAIWEPENCFRIRLDIEAYACEAQAELGVIPESAARAVREKGAFEVARIRRDRARDAVTTTIAFLTNLAEHVGPEARFVHQGMTSSDVLDTCLAVQLTQAADILLADLDAAARRAEAARGRAQIHADRRAQPRHPRRADDLRAEARRALGRVRPQPRAPRRGAASEIATCAISGAVGTFANIDPRVEAYVAEKLGLVPEPVSTQMIPRDRHAAFFMALALIAAGDRAARDRDPPSAAHRTARGRGVFRARAEGLVGDAAQAQPGPVGKPDRAGAA